jgi:nucleoside-diphosphate-sugar epimerase
VYQPLPTADDPTRRRPDITRVREILGWQPHVDLALGLQQTIDWFRGEIQAPTDVLMAAV